MQSNAQSTSRSVLLSVALTATGVAVKIAGGNFHPAAVALIGLAIVLALACKLRLPLPAPSPSRLVRVGGGVLIGITMVALFTGRIVPPTTTPTPEPGAAPMYAILNFHGINPPPPLENGATAVRAGYGLVAALGIAALCWGFSSRPTLRRSSPLLLGGALFAHLVTQFVAVQAAPAPVIDVLVFQSASIDALVNGVNPYAGPFVDITGGSSPHYDASLMANGLLHFGYPYPPLTLCCLLMNCLAAASVQYAHAAAFTLSAALIGFSRRTSAARFAALLFMLTPTGSLVVCYGWTEPLVAVFLALTVFLACRIRDTTDGPDVGGNDGHAAGATSDQQSASSAKQSRRHAGAVRPELTPPRVSTSRSSILLWTGIALGLFWSAKQYVPLTAPLASLLAGASLSPRRLGRLVIPAVVAGAAVSLPLALWDWSAFWHSTVAVQFRQPFRDDALSFLALLHRTTGSTPPAWIGFVALAGVMALALWRSPRGVAGFAAATAASLLVFFAFSKQAFAGYYFLVSAAFACAIAAGSHGALPTHGSQSSDGQPATKTRRARKPTE